MNPASDFERTLSTWAPENPGECRTDPAELLGLAEQLQQSGAVELETSAWHAYLDYSRSAPFSWGGLHRVGRTLRISCKTRLNDARTGWASFPQRLAS